MATDQVSISLNLASIAERFGIDLSAFADQVLTERILRDPVSSLTARMHVALLTAQKTARAHGQNHIGAEHVVLAILLDPHSIPSQMLQDLGVREGIIEEIQAMLASDSYNRRVEPKGGATNVPT